MRLGILSDTHDNIWKLADAIEHLKTADVVIHCGDLCAPFIAKRMGEGLPDIPIHIVWGNNDGDPHAISRVASNYSHIHLHGQFAKLDLDGFRVGVNHYPEIAIEFADSGNFNLVCYGHDHTAHQERRGDCLLLNPGEIMGMNGKSTLAIYNLQTDTVEMIEL
jgi:putative phosphoesterase